MQAGKSDREGQDQGCWSGVGPGAARAIRHRLKAGADRYDRTRDLPGLARVDPRDLTADTFETANAILMQLERALRAERKRARSGHWSYDLNRHIALRQAHTAETERLQDLRAKQS